LHHLFAQQVRHAPDAVALVFDGGAFSYGELDKRANRLAHRLRRRGIGPDVLVGLCAERSAELIIGILAILKAGGAYVPLDPAYPRERLALMLEEAQVPVLVTQSHLAGRLGEYRGKMVFTDESEATPDTPPANDVKADHLAYVIFTSGSTGRPKGVMVRHRNVVRLFRATQSFFRFHAGDVWTLFHSFAFDFSVWELWGALLYGGRLVVVPYATSRSARAFYDLLVSERVSVLNQTPSAFRQLMQAEAAVSPNREAHGKDELALRWIIFGGEALALPSLRPWFERHGDQRPRLVNMYGITETTVHVTCRPLTRADADAGLGSVIGTPLPGWRIHLLDARGRTVPPGEIGEIYVGGEGVARGYLNRPELTAQRFIRDPFSAEPSSALYRSGDLARCLPDGELVYLGRADHQVKVRGFRVELLEIEAALARHPAVREAAVLVREDDGGEKRLVAYVAVGPAGAPTGPELRTFLQDQLPDYMVPGAFVLLDRLPVTEHGKVHRDLLPPPSNSRPDLRQGFVDVRGNCQRRLQQIWEKILHVRPVGARDRFLELGGDSLSAMALCLEIKKIFGKELSPVVLYEGATIEGLAEMLTRSGDAPSWSPLVPLQPKGNWPPFFFVHPLGGQVLGYRSLAQAMGEERPFYGLQGAPVGHAVEGPERIEDRAASYLVEVLRVQPEGPYSLGGYSLGAFLAFEMARQLRRQGRRVAFLGLVDDGPALLHDRVVVDLAETMRFLGNLPRWTAHQALRKGPAAICRDVCRKLHVWRRRLIGPATAGADVEEVLDVSRYPENYRRRMAAGYAALKRYVPRLYRGRVTLFRARIQPLLGAHVPDLGWGRRAVGGVEVHVIPGDHDSIILEPDVRILATRLAEGLDRAR
jgi:amino acid adenylation domain-containing protein